MTDRQPGGSLAHLLAWRLAEAPDAGFVLVEDDGPWTYRQLAAAAVRVASGLSTLSPGDRVVIRVGNDERFLPALCAVWSREAAVVPMHPAAPAEEVARVVASLGVTAVVADPDDPCAGAVDVPVVAFPRIPVDDPGTEAAGYTAPTRDVGAAPALVLLTSGTTGAPKGVVLTHDSAWSSVRATVSAFRTDTSATPLAGADKPPNLISNPLSHTSGVVRLIFALYVGRRIALLRKFDARTAKRLIDAHGIDSLTLNPTMLRLLLDTLEPGEDLGRVKYVGSGTAPLPAALREEFEARFAVPVLQAYGQTEAFGGITVESVKDVLAGHRRPGSVGRALPGVELRIVRAAGTDAAVGEQGEIRARSRSTTAGYLGGEPGTSPLDSPLDSDGWLRTGDLGHLDADGYLYITGRLKNVIICGGFNVIPEEVEAALAEDPRVRDASVVGLPDDKFGEIPVAFVETNATADQVLAAVAPRLAPYKRPRRVYVVAELPKVANGKVDRPAVQKLAEAAAP